MRTTLGSGVDTGMFLPHARGSREYLAVEKGTLLVTLDGKAHTLNAGDSIYYDGDCIHGYRNLSRVPCVFYAAMDVTGDVAGTNHRLAPPTVESDSEMDSTKHELGSARSQMQRRRKMQGGGRP
jgi:hypothetical protein